MAAPAMVGEVAAPPPPAQRLVRDNPPPPPPTLLVPPPYDPALDPAIKQLLDQQAEIQAKLAQLLPQKYGPNIKIELEMLRHKLLVLEAYATDNRELLFVTSTSASACMLCSSTIFVFPSRLHNVPAPPPCFSEQSRVSFLSNRVGI